MDVRSENYLILLNCINSKPRQLIPVTEYPTVQELESVWPVDETEVLALDFETKGVDIFDPEFQVLGLGVSYSTGSFYINLVNCTPELKQWLVDKLFKHRLLAFNVVFDGLILQHFSGEYFWDNWLSCCYGLFKQLATEGYLNQSWSLEEAEHRLLGWPESNKDGLNTWLIENGCINKSTKAADKSQMWKAPFEVISKYCALDADACWQLYFLVFVPYLKRFPFLKIYHERYFINAIKLAVEQYMYGNAIDTGKLISYNKELLNNIKDFELKLLTHPQVVEHIAEYNEFKVQEFTDTRKPKQQFKKDGTISKNYINYINKIEELKKINHFNLNSDEQLRWLLYERLEMPISVLTKSGKPAVSNKVLKGFGEVGQLLLDYNGLTKLQGYVQTVIDEVREGIVHVKIRPGSTLTGRASGGEGQGE